MNHYIPGFESVPVGALNTRLAPLCGDLRLDDVVDVSCLHLLAVNSRKDSEIHSKVLSAPWFSLKIARLSNCSILWLITPN
jgi:hypothetical protein